MLKLKLRRKTKKKKKNTKYDRFESVKADTVKKLLSERDESLVKAIDEVIALDKAHREELQKKRLLKQLKTTFLKKLE